MLRAKYTHRAAIGANVLCSVVAVTGALVMFGWFFDITLLKGIYPGGRTMKFVTSVSFVLSAAVFYCVGRIARGDRAWAQVLLPTLVLMILLLIASLLAAFALDINIGVTAPFAQGSDVAMQTVQSGSPTTVTIFCFTLVSAVGLMAMFEPGGKLRLWRIVAAALAILGSFALLGHLLEIPALYYYRASAGTGMAAHTALLFVLLGAALWLNTASIGGGQEPPHP